MAFEKEVNAMVIKQGVEISKERELAVDIAQGWAEDLNRLSMLPGLSGIVAE